MAPKQVVNVSKNYSGVIGTHLQSFHFFLVRDSDYSADSPLEVTFMSGSAMQDSTSCAQITILDDLTFEGPHSFSMEVSTVEIESDGTDPLLTIGTMSSAMINIEDNDSKLFLLKYTFSIVTDSTYFLQS